jgi:transcriptional regulator with XRE-family HTH domain
VRAARGLLGWSQTELAAKAGVSLPTVKRTEGAGKHKGSEPSLLAMKEALEAAGVIFIAENGEGPGVRLRKS